MNTTSESVSSVKRSHPALRALGRVAVALVLGLAFLGYVSPEMRLQWENLMALCGF